MSNLDKSIEYWQGLLKMQVLKKSDKAVELTYGGNQAVLELCDIGTSLKKAFIR